MVDWKTSIQVILQARASSKRLPGKILLPIGEMPLLELIIRRVRNTGLPICVATSEERSDDETVSLLERLNVNYFRGSLNNVLDRFIQCLSTSDDDDICVRITGDNPFPDGHFIRSALNEFLKSNSRYLSFGGTGEWLPYGLSCEIFYVGDLRKSVEYAQNQYDVEHVTPALKKMLKDEKKVALNMFDRNLGHLRCTIDTQDDYEIINSIFDKVQDPINHPATDLVALLPKYDQVITPTFVLGTVQLGLPYGMKRNEQLMPKKKALQILGAATNLGIVEFDTARNYGESEARIGEYAQNISKTNTSVITKLPKLSFNQSQNLNENYKNEIDKHIDESIANLQREQIDVLLLHDASNLSDYGGGVIRHLNKRMAEGIIRKVGVSVQTPNELKLALSIPSINHIQLPYNILEHRFDALIPKLVVNSDLTIHARSIFLQGVLLENHTKSWPKIDNFEPRQLIIKINELVNELGRSSKLDLCIAYVRSKSWINGLVIGVDNERQLEQIKENFQAPPLTWDETNRINDQLGTFSDKLLDPSKWVWHR